MNRRTNQGRVLVVDDDPLIRGLLSKIVKREGMIPDTASDGVEALRYLEFNEYEAVLLDLMMPRLNGFEIVDYLAERDPIDRPIVIIVTAYGDDEWRDLNPSVVTGVVRKPFEITELGELLKRCVEREISDEITLDLPAHLAPSH